MATDFRERFPQYWARGSSGHILCWGWSQVDMGSAQAVADRRAGELAKRSLEDLRRSDRCWAYYPERPVRELILGQVTASDLSLLGLVTRNSYGCEILNARRAMFVDIDRPESPKNRPGLLARLFRRRPPEADASSDPWLDEALARAEAWTQAHPGWAWRVYQTFGGLRLLATHATMDPTSSDSDLTLSALGSDPLYRRLCQSQQCYRARLTPKPWRCGLPDKPPRWPWGDGAVEKSFGQWLERYDLLRGNFSTCHLIAEYGPALVHPEIRPIVEAHDQMTAARLPLPLA